MLGQRIKKMSKKKLNVQVSLDKIDMDKEVREELLSLYKNEKALNRKIKRLEEKLETAQKKVKEIEERTKEALLMRQKFQELVDKYSDHDDCYYYG